MYATNQVIIQQNGIKLWLGVVTYTFVGIVIAVNIKHRQNIDIHLVEQAGHLRVTAIGGQSLR